MRMVPKQTRPSLSEIYGVIPEEFHIVALLDMRSRSPLGFKIDPPGAGRLLQVPFPLYHPWIELILAGSSFAKWWITDQRLSLWQAYRNEGPFSWLSVESPVVLIFSRLTASVPCCPVTSAPSLRGSTQKQPKLKSSSVFSEECGAQSFISFLMMKSADFIMMFDRRDPVYNN